MIYCDTSLIVAALTAEIASEAAREWLDNVTLPLALSAWTQVEVASALERKVRRGALDPEGLRSVQRSWSGLRDAMIMLPIDDGVFAGAAAMVVAEPRGLRAGDALHLSVVLAARCDLVTLDRDLADAARARGVTVHAVRYPAA